MPPIPRRPSSAHTPREIAGSTTRQNSRPRAALVPEMPASTHSKLRIQPPTTRRSACNGDESRFDPFPVLHRLDKNRDGILRAREIPEGAWEFVDGIAAQLGLGEWEELDLDRLKSQWSDASTDFQSAQIPVVRHGKTLSNNLKLLISVSPFTDLLT